VALQTHINDVMLRRYSKTRPVTASNGGGTPLQNELSNKSSAKSPSGDVYEKRVHELSRALEESRKNADQVRTLLPIMFGFSC
jgi:hypothetical protein